MLALAFELLAGSAGDSWLEQGDSSRLMSRRIRIDSALVERLRHRDQDAFDELLATTFEPLVAIASSIVGSADVAEDVVQEVMVWIWEQGEHWVPGASAAAYVIGAVRHRALNWMRRRGVESTYEARFRAERHSAQTHDSRSAWEAEVRDLEAALARALTVLTERQRTAFLLRVEQRLTIAEVATALEIGERAAEKLVSRAMRVIRDELGRGA